MLQPCYRRVIPVKALMRGFGLVFLSVIILGLTGCGTDNETDATKLQTSTGPPPALPPGAEKSIPTPPLSSMDDYAKSKTDPYKGTKFETSKKK
jgi:hypothetical protein